MTELELMQDVGDNIQRMLDEWGMSQNELAKEIGVNKTTISRYVRGEMLPTLKNLINIAYVLECDISDFITVTDFIE